MKKFLLILLLTTSTLFSANAVQKIDKFTAQEQQQISVPTRGLFDKSQEFVIDFAKIHGYSFPLPVGKVVGSTARDLEIESKPGDAIKAMFSGTVRLSRNVAPWGNVIVIRHDNGLETVYGCNASNRVKSGMRVAAGQTIALLGKKNGKGYLLFSIMVSGGRINPSTLIDVNSHALKRRSLKFKKSGDKVLILSSHDEAKESTEGTHPTLDTKNQASGNTNPIPEMDLSTNDPFAGKATYRLDLDKMTSSQWHYPLDNSHVISGYGGKRGHAGADIKNGPGTNVYAAFDGKVVQAGNFSGYGKCITIRHTNGIETRYSHQSKNFVQVGDMVKAGQVIGIVGRTGRATTEHLHFETRIAGRAFNPEYIFDHKNHVLQKGILQFKRGGGVVRLK